VLKGTSIGENLRDIRRRVLREWSRRTKAAGSGGRALAGCTPGAVSIKAKNKIESCYFNLMGDGGVRGLNDRLAPGAYSKPQCRN
jgi:hypothetical protein